MSEKKKHNRIQSTKILSKKGIGFESKNNGVHLIVHSKAGKVDFYPSTGKYIRRKDNVRGRGVFNLLDVLDSSGAIDSTDGCDVCGTFPYINSTGMCATCTFGEADAQQELISGEMEGAVWEREKVNDVCPVKLDDRDKAINALKNLGVIFKECNNGMQLNIKTHAGLVLYWPTTRKVRHNKMTKTLFWLNSDSSGDIVDFIKKLGFDKKDK